MPAYTNIAKPAGTGYTNLAKPTGIARYTAGMTIGLLIPLTIAQPLPYGFPYTNVSKPTGAGYTNIAKPAT